MGAVSRATLPIVAVLAMAAGCSGPRGGTPGAPGPTGLQPVSLPGLSAVDGSVREQIEGAYAAVADLLRHGSDTDVLGSAYGRLGMVLQAAEYYEAAEPSLLNAQALAPDEVRWPYFLGHLYQSRGRLTDAKAAFARTLELRPDDLATLIWLGRVHLDEGNVDEAEALFTRASAQAPDAIAVLAGLGRAALTRRDYAMAAARFERALEVDAEALSFKSMFLEKVVLLRNLQHFTF
jgi:tetratricopeptide (TPR) repeat protein